MTGPSGDLRERLAKLRELSEKATRGPWSEWSEEGPDSRGVDTFSLCYAPLEDDEKHECIAETRGKTNEQSRANQKFIVACVNYVREALLTPEQPSMLREALERSMVALDDWLNVHASDHCDPKRVAEARKRIKEYGTIGYIAKVQEANRAALAAATPEPAMPPKCTCVQHPRYGVEINADCPLHGDAPEPAVPAIPQADLTGAYSLTVQLARKVVVDYDLHCEAIDDPDPAWLEQEIVRVFGKVPPQRGPHDTGCVCERCTASSPPAPEARAMADAATDYCPKCSKLIMRPNVSYGIHPDAVCTCTKKIDDPCAQRAAPPSIEREPHRQTTVWVRVEVDEGIAELVKYLQTVPGVWTDASCQGTIGEGGPHPYRAQVMCHWTSEGHERLKKEFDITLAEETNGAWGYVHPREGWRPPAPIRLAVEADTEPTCKCGHPESWHQEFARTSNGAVEPGVDFKKCSYCMCREFELRTLQAPKETGNV